MSLLTEKEAAKALGLSVKTLQARRFKRQQPSYVKIGRLVRYKPEVIEAFIAENTITFDGHAA